MLISTHVEIICVIISFLSSEHHHMVPGSDIEMPQFILLGYLEEPDHNLSHLVFSSPCA